MDLLAAWLLFPLALGVICLGLGLLVERLTGWALPGPLLLPAGFVALLAVAQLVTSRGDTAPFTLAVVCVLAVAGAALGRARLLALRPDPWLTVAALGVFAMFAAAVVASGKPSLAGYLALPDTGHQLALAELYAQRGPNWFELPVLSSIREGVTPYVLAGYPVAPQAALGVTAPLGVIDLAWLYQPFMTFTALMLFCALASMTRALFEQRWRSTIVAFVAAQPALVVSYAMQGSIKELAAVAVIMTTIALVYAAITEQRSARALIAAAIAAAALLGAIGASAAAYVAVPALAVLVHWGLRLARQRRIAELGWLGVAAGTLVLLALPVLVVLREQLFVVSGTLDAGEHAAGSLRDLGNLAAPLDLAQALGVWFAGDYRYRTLQAGTAQDVALWIAGAFAVLGLVWAIRRRVWPALFLLASVALPSIGLLLRGNAYADGKVLAIASPAVVLFVILGAACLWRGRWRALSLVSTVAVTGAVLASGALVYHDASLAPHDRYEEMKSVAQRIPGKRVLLNEYDEFAKYFLSGADALNEPEADHLFRKGLTDPDADKSRRFDPDAYRDKRRRPSVKVPLDMDDLTLRYVQQMPYIMLRRSPTASRPPANFRRIWRGTYYELWRRGAGPRVLAHVPLGRSVLVPAAPVTREQARAIGRRAQRLGGRIAYVPRARMAMFLVSHHPRPQRWGGFGDFPEGIVTDGPGRIQAPVRIPRTGSYHVWLEGSFARALTLRIDGREIGPQPAGLNNPGAYASLGTVRLRRGDRGVQLVQGGGDLRPGNGGYRSSLRHLGPMLFNPVENEPAGVREIGARDWRRLVGVRADWVEVVADE